MVKSEVVYASRVIPAQEFLYAGWRHLGIEEHLTATFPARGAAGANTRHARLCHRASEQVKQHQSLVHVTSRFLRRMSVRHQGETGATCATFSAGRDLRMDIVTEREGLRDASTSELRHKYLLFDVTYTDTQAGVNLGAGCANQDGSAASTPEAQKRDDYARPGHVSFDERIHKLVTIAVKTFGRLRREGIQRNDQLATSREL